MFLSPLNPFKKLQCFTNEFEKEYIGFVTSKRLLSKVIFELLVSTIKLDDKYNSSSL